MRPALEGVTRVDRGERYQIYRAGASSRGVEVHEQPPEVSVRLVALASPEDWTLAYEFLAAYAGDPAAIATGEDGTTGACGALADAFAEVMLRETAASLVGLEAA